MAEALCPACHHRDHDPGSCEWCPNCELHTDEALDWLMRHDPMLATVGSPEAVAAYAARRPAADRRGGPAVVLADALAAALEAYPESRFTIGTKFDAHDFPYEVRYDREAHAAAILADPAFREALTAALAEAIDHGRDDYHQPLLTAWDDQCEYWLTTQQVAAAIVANMLPETGQ